MCVSSRGARLAAALVHQLHWHISVVVLSWALEGQAHCGVGGRATAPSAALAACTLAVLDLELACGPAVATSHKGRGSVRSAPYKAHGTQLHVQGQGRNGWHHLLPEHVLMLQSVSSERARLHWSLGPLPLASKALVRTLVPHPHRAEQLDQLDHAVYSQPSSAE